MAHITLHINISSMGTNGMGFQGLFTVILHSEFKLDHWYLRTDLHYYIRCHGHMSSFPRLIVSTSTVVGFPVLFGQSFVGSLNGTGLAQWYLRLRTKNNNNKKNWNTNKTERKISIIWSPGLSWEPRVPILRTHSSLWGTHNSRYGIIRQLNEFYYYFCFPDISNITDPTEIRRDISMVFFLKKNATCSLLGDQLYIKMALFSQTTCLIL